MHAHVQVVFSRFPKQEAFLHGSAASMVGVGPAGWLNEYHRENNCTIAIKTLNTGINLRVQCVDALLLFSCTSTRGALRCFFHSVVVMLFSFFANTVFIYQRADLKENKNETVLMASLT